MNKNVLISKVDKIRSQISELSDERHWLENAVLPPNEMHERICGFIDDMADKFSDNWNGFDSSSLTANGRILEGLNATATDLGPILCALLGDQIKDTLKKKIASAGYEAGPPTKDRQEMIADVDKRLHDLEKQEESLICQASEVGQTIPRRDTVSPAIILEFVD